MATDNSKQPGITYDAVTVMQTLGIGKSQLSTLVRTGTLPPCNTPTGPGKFYRRFTPEAVEVARVRMPEVLYPQRKPQPRQVDETDVLARIDARLAAIEGQLAQWELERAARKANGK